MEERLNNAGASAESLSDSETQRLKSLLRETEQVQAVMKRNSELEELLAKETMKNEGTNVCVCVGGLTVFIVEIGMEVHDGYL